MLSLNIKYLGFVDKSCSTYNRLSLFALEMKRLLKKANVQH